MGDEPTERLSNSKCPDLMYLCEQLWIYSVGSVCASVCVHVSVCVSVCVYISNTILREAYRALCLHTEILATVAGFLGPQALNYDMKNSYSFESLVFSIGLSHSLL